jgi:leucyl-tRNA synthetase
MCGGEVRHAVTVKWHQTMKRATEAIEALRYNTAIAAYMELVNVLRDTRCCDRQVVQDLVVMLAPFAPHFAEECWERLGHRTSVFDELWPEWDEHLVVEDDVEVAVQVNGKTRSKLSVPRDSSEDAVVAAALADETTVRFVGEKEIRKRIYVPNRLLNLVVG